jgi:hypothetical protein
LKNQNIKHFNCDSYGASSCIPLFRAQDPVAKAGGRGIRRRGGACWGGRAWRRLRKRASREHRKEKKNNAVSQSHSVSSAFGLTTKLKKQLVSSLMHLNPDSCKRQPPPEWFYRQGLLPDYRPL